MGLRGGPGGPALQSRGRGHGNHRPPKSARAERQPCFERSRGRGLFSLSLVHRTKADDTDNRSLGCIPRGPSWATLRHPRKDRQRVDSESSRLLSFPQAGRCLATNDSQTTRNHSLAERLSGQTQESRRGYDRRYPPGRLHRRSIP